MCDDVLCRHFGRMYVKSFARRFPCLFPLACAESMESNFPIVTFLQTNPFFRSPKKVMHDEDRDSVLFPSLENYEEQILHDLRTAAQAFWVYRHAKELPTDDYFFVAGELQSLIRNAENLVLYHQEVLQEDSASFNVQQWRLKSLIAEVKKFRRYIVQSVRK